MKLEITLAAVLATLPVPAFANVNPYAIESSCQYNMGLTSNLAPKNSQRVCSSQTTKPACEQYSFCWWRDTSKQNELSQHTADAFADTVVSLYDNGTLKIFDYQAPFASNVVLITTPTSYAIVGCGGGVSEAMYAKTKLATQIGSRVLRAIVIPDAYPESIWGCSTWRGTSLATVYTSFDYVNALDLQDAVGAELLTRTQQAYGTFLSWGSDSFLGNGFGRESRATPPQPVLLPDVVVSPPNVTIYLDSYPVTLTPLAGIEASLEVSVPAANLAVLPTSGAYLPDLGGPVHPRTSIPQWIATLEHVRAQGFSILAPMHGTPILDDADVESYLIQQHDALKYLHDQTLVKINQHLSLGDMMTSINLPGQLVTPYTLEFASTVPSIVRSVYTEYLGWYDGDVTQLHPMSPLAHDKRLIDMAGGPGQALSFGRKCLSDHTRDGVQMALEVATALDHVAPSADVTALYRQALRMSAFDETSGYLRNYYLSKLAATQTP